MSEKISDRKCLAGLILMMLPSEFLLVSLAVHGIINMLTVLAGTAVFLAGVWIVAHAHEHAKSLHPCGRHAR